MSTSDHALKNQFLIAMPSLDDAHFNKTVSLVCEHSDHGAVGLVINRPLQLKLSEIFEQLGLDNTSTDPEAIVFWGGPVQPERGFVIHRAPGGWESSLPLSDDLYVTTSRDVLLAISQGEGPHEFVVVLGYAGWGAGQLESEILRNSWLNTDADNQILFQTPPAKRWAAATRLLGVEVTQLTAHAGHA